jgi:pilus assembly protein CpaF
MHLPPLLAVLIADREVSDVFLNSATETLIHRNRSSELANNPFRSEFELIDFAKTAIEMGGDHLDYANPLCDAVLTSREIPELSTLEVASLRIHAVLAHGVSKKNLLSIRVHRLEPPKLEQFENHKQLQEIAVSRSFVISGGAGAGKTTLLRAMLAVRPEPRTVLIEDSAELLPLAGHFIGLTSRAANSEGRGEVALERLLRESLRMRPERLVIGEVRGAEVATLLQALNIGVSQVAFTLHANQARHVKSRLQSLWLQTGQLLQDLDGLLTTQKTTVIHMSQHKVDHLEELR